MAYASRLKTIAKACSPSTLIGLILVCISVGLVAGKQTDLRAPIFSMDYGFGPQIKSIVQEHRTGGSYGIGGVSDPQGKPAYAARMPLIPLLGAASYLISPSGRVFFLLKNAIFLSLWIYAVLRLKIDEHIGDKWLWIIFGGMLLSGDTLQTFGFLDVEEGYLSSLLTLLFVVLVTLKSTVDCIGVGIAVASIYLTKSSMLPVCSVAVVWPLITAWKRLKLSTLIPAFLLTLAVVGWGSYIYSLTGTFAVGVDSSSWNGWNFYKANNPYADALYPHTNLDTLDTREYANRLLPTTPHRDEWELSHQQLALGQAFVRAHPDQVIKMDLKKLYIACCALEDAPDFAPGNLADRFANLGDHVLVASVVLIALMNLLRGRPAKAELLALFFFAAYLIPYIVGFLYSRHMIPVYCLAAFALVIQLNSLLRGSGQSEQTAGSRTGPGLA